MKDFELRYVGSHVEVYTGSGVFLFSADMIILRRRPYMTSMIINTKVISLLYTISEKMKII